MSQTHLKDGNPPLKLSLIRQYSFSKLNFNERLQRENQGEKSLNSKNADSSFFAFLNFNFVLNYEKSEIHKEFPSRSKPKIVIKISLIGFTQIPRAQKRKIRIRWTDLGF